MNTNITSRDAILEACRRIVAERGMKALSMRLVADECHIALGTLYNYFADKDALVLATVESIWRDVFHGGDTNPAKASFTGYVAELYERMRRGAQAYPGFLTGHAIGIAGDVRGEARGRMDGALAHIRAGMLEALRRDPSVPQAAFTAEFTREAFVGFVLNHLLILLVQGQPDCAALLEIIRRVLRG